MMGADRQNAILKQPMFLFRDLLRPGFSKKEKSEQKLNAPISLQKFYKSGVFLQHAFSIGWYFYCENKHGLALHKNAPKNPS